MEKKDKSAWANKDRNPMQTISYDCPYFADGRICSIKAFSHHARNNEWYEHYLEKGFRRTADIFYKNICETCEGCIPIRVPVKTFEMSKSQRKTFNKNSDIKLVVRESSGVGQENIALYKDYIKKHKGSENYDEKRIIEDLMHMHLGYPNILEMDYFLEDTLIAVGVVDETKNALSSVYCYYDTRFEKRRLGIFTILKEIELANTMKKDYYYLGYYIKDTAKMAYKAIFKPNEIFCKNRWKIYKDK